MKKSALKKAITHAGSQNRLAKLLKVERQVVNNWVKRGQVPATECQKVQDVTRGAVTVHQLRPDVFAAQ